MSMNNPNQPQPEVISQQPVEVVAEQPAVETTTVQPTAPAQAEVVSPAQPVTPDQAAQSPQAQGIRDEQVVAEVGQALAQDVVTAEDIMTAVLSDTLGISPAGAQSLFRLLMQDIAGEAQQENEMQAQATAQPTPQQDAMQQQQMIQNTNMDQQFNA